MNPRGGGLPHIDAPAVGSSIGLTPLKATDCLYVLPGRHHPTEIALIAHYHLHMLSASCSRYCERRDTWSTQSFVALSFVPLPLLHGVCLTLGEFSGGVSPEGGCLLGGADLAPLRHLRPPHPCAEYRPHLPPLAQVATTCILCTQVTDPEAEEKETISTGRQRAFVGTVDLE